MARARLTLLYLLQTGQRDPAVILLVLLGGAFVLVNVALDLLYRALDPRLRDGESEIRPGAAWWQWLASMVSGLWATLTLRRLRQRRAQRETGLSSLRPIIRRSSEDLDRDREDLRSKALMRRHACCGRPLANRPCWLAAP